MSERSDLINKLPDRHLNDPDFVYDLESITNNYDDILHALLISKVGLSSDVVNDYTDWNSLEVNSVYLVTSWSGNHAPAITGDKGIVFTVGSPSSEMQIAFAYNNDTAKKIGIRINDNSWTYINQGMTPTQTDNAIKSAFQGVDIKSAANNITTLNTQISSVSNSISANASAINQNTSSLATSERADIGSANANINTRVSLASERNDVDSLSANAESSADSLARSMDTKENASSEDSDVRSINDSLDAKLDVTSEKSDLKSAYSAIGSKEDIASHKSDMDSLSTEIKSDVANSSFTTNKTANPDLNKDVKSGNYLITDNADLSHAPKVVFHNHNNGLLEVRNLPNNNVLQVVYFTLGNPDTTSVDGSGSVSYRFQLNNDGNSSWQAWKTIPYESDSKNTISNINNSIKFIKELFNISAGKQVLDIPDSENPLELPGNKAYYFDDSNYDTAIVSFHIDNLGLMNVMYDGSMLVSNPSDSPLPAGKDINAVYHIPIDQRGNGQHIDFYGEGARISHFTVTLYRSAITDIGDNINIINGKIKSLSNNTKNNFQDAITVLNQLGTQNDLMASTVNEDYNQFNLNYKKLNTMVDQLEAEKSQLKFELFGK